MNQTPADAPFSVEEFILHFWRRRYLILIALPLFFVLGYVIMYKYGGEIFQTTALLQTRTAPSELRRGPQMEPAEAPIYEDIFRNDELLREVIQAAREEFPEFPQSGFEHLKGRFKVDVIMTRETAVVAEFSPVIRLTTEQANPEFTYFLATTWLAKALDKYGALRYQEAEEIITTFSDKVKTYEEGLRSWQQAEEEAKIRLSEATRKLAVAQDMLYGSEGDGSEGILQKQQRVEEELAEAISLHGEEHQEVESLRQKADRYEEKEVMLNERIDAASQEKIEWSVKLNDLRDDLLITREKLAEAREIVKNASADSVLLPDPLNPENKGDFIILSRPVKPEVMIAPNRLLFTIVIAGALSGTLLVFLLLEFYLRLALKKAA